MRGISANVMCGQEGNFGTGAFQLYLNMNKIDEITKDIEKPAEEEVIKDIFDQEVLSDPCNLSNIRIQNNASNVKKIDYGDDDDYEIDAIGFKP